ncbi:putative 3-hydroxyacyl-CoA dehyrogenase [Talaromyces proteolyticus]|uniref:L-gulonate 3-dehydrogenase n=1 Tax=Talaromyces proteolyticus TaxID=1131652 RepID=A0AAD4L136_9EURO|nr:putative 3-hydroxyacyl-CoA dehyrogenase [Talaromyces proteolyticus]KAH8701925.1 putative 3-hydroxyacyl-CoA dehyrogenase [Talaromyces proteolyticus]
MADGYNLCIAVIGSGTIGLSFAALHLSHPSKNIKVIIYDPRPDLNEYIESTLPGYLNATSPSLSSLRASNRLVLSSSLVSAVESADVVQEQGPENVSFKQSLWPQIEAAASPSALFWSSTSGIPASIQGANMQAPYRLLIVHPFNPPHIMPVLEIVPPDQHASKAYIDKTVSYWRTLNRNPVILKEEITGFVANRLSFALFREAIHLVNQGVVTAEEVDRIVEESMGPRWAVKGPFWSYHAGGGEKGLSGFLDKIGETVQACWDDAGTPELRDGEDGKEAAWRKALGEQVEGAYGVLQERDLRERDEKTRSVLEITRGD